MTPKVVTVIGANGSMGKNISAIFASFGNAEVHMVCRNINKSILAKNEACGSVRSESIQTNLIPEDYSALPDVLKRSDLVFESVSEEWNVKTQVMEDIGLIVKNNVDYFYDTVFCTGSSGLSVTTLSEFLPMEIRGNYMGMHMFNPPYTMSLCELIPTKYSNKKIFDSAKRYCKEVLYRTVVEVKDCPAFLANRIGFQFINSALIMADKYKFNGGIDYIDSILGPFTGRSMPPLLTSDFVGLDVHKAIVDNIYKNTDDYANRTFKIPSFAKKLIYEGKLGRKKNEGLYKTIIHESGLKIRQVYDIESDSYRNVIKYTFPFSEHMINFIREGNYSSAFGILVSNRSLEANLCCEMLLKYVLYAVNTSLEVGYDIHSADDVMAAGFNWCPPLAIVDALGGIEVFKNLCSDRFSTETLKKMNSDSCFMALTPSKYDFRKYIRAKK